MAKRLIRVLAVILALLLPILTASVAFAENEEPQDGQSQKIGRAHV